MHCRFSEARPPTTGPRLFVRAVDDIAPASILVGRDQPLARLRAALLRAEAGSRSVVLVSGESGIGKTELVRAATRGRPLLAWGTCVDDAAAGGLWPWSRA